MTENSNSNPQLTLNTSPLKTLSLMALRRYGESSPSAIYGDLSHMMLGFANNVIEDVRDHPYWRDGNGAQIPIDYYLSIDDKRDLPDEIVLSGLVAYYSLQQASQKSQIWVPMYYRRMNQILYNRKYGNTELRLKVVDYPDDDGYTNGVRDNE